MLFLKLFSSNNRSFEQIRLVFIQGFRFFKSNEVVSNGDTQKVYISDC